MKRQRERHKCPRCQELTSKSFYCADCADNLRKPPFHPAMMQRSTRYVFDQLPQSRTVHGRHESREAV